MLGCEAIAPVTHQDQAGRRDGSGLPRRFRIDVETLLDDVKLIHAGHMGIVAPRVLGRNRAAAGRRQGQCFGQGQLSPSKPAPEQGGVRQYENHRVSRLPFAVYGVGAWIQARWYLSYVVLI